MKMLKKIYKKYNSFILLIRILVIKSLWFIFPQEIYDELMISYQGLKKHKSKYNLYSLVRDLHRLEKGLTFEVRRDVFAIGYVKEALTFFQSNYNEFQLEPYREYGLRVFSAYFNHIPDSVLVDERSQFLTWLNKSNDRSNVRELGEDTLFNRELLLAPPDQRVFLEELIIRRRSVRSYNELSCEDLDVIKRLLDTCTNAPSACNRLPYRFICTQGDLKNEALKIPMGTAGWLETVSLYIVVVGDLSAYFDLRDRHAPYIDASLALMQFILLLESYNYGSCVVNWSDIPSKNRRIRELLKLERHEVVITTLAVGAKKEFYQTPRSVKRSIYEFRG